MGGVFLLFSAIQAMAAALHHENDRTLRQRALDSSKRLSIVFSDDHPLLKETPEPWSTSRATGHHDATPAKETAKKKAIISCPTNFQTISHVPPPRAFKRPRRFIRWHEHTQAKYNPTQEDFAMLESIESELPKRVKDFWPNFAACILQFEDATQWGDPIDLSRAKQLLGHLLDASLITKIHSHWLDRRRELGKPLRRCYWPVPAQDDPEPSTVFRSRLPPRNPMRLRRRKNAADVLGKAKRLREDLDAIQNLIKLVRKREMLKLQMAEVARDGLMQSYLDEGIRPSKHIPLKVQRTQDCSTPFARRDEKLRLSGLNRAAPGGSSSDRNNRFHMPPSLKPNQRLEREAAELVARQQEAEVVKPQPTAYVREGPRGTWLDFEPPKIVSIEEMVSRYLDDCVQHYEDLSDSDSDLSDGDDDLGNIKQCFEAFKRQTVADVAAPRKVVLKSKLVA